jgi:hypothetical protein
MPSESSKPGTPKPQTPKGGGFVPGLLLFLVEILLPTLLLGSALIYLFGALNVWSISPSAMRVLFAACLVVFSFITSATIDSFTRGLRKTSNKSAALRWRLVKLVLGGLIIPAGLFAAVNLIYIPGGETGMDMLVRISMAPAKVAQIVKFENAILKTDSVETRTRGIEALEAIQSPEAMDTLLRLLQIEPALLNDAGQYRALSKAIASYGSDAKVSLISLYQQTDPASASSVDLNLYDYYFALPVQSLQDVAPDQTEAVQALEADILSRLAQIEAAQLSTAPAGSLVHAFILDTFIQMDIKQDKELLNLAKLSAANTAFPAGVRGRALLLIGKLGDNIEIETLFPYLESQNSYLQARAFQAITWLQKKNSVSDPSQK